jgi:hypothetical protein
MLQDTLSDLMGGVILKLDQLRKDLNTPAHASALAFTSHTRSKARMFAVDAAERIDRELNPRETVQAQTEGQGAREVDAREIATILNLRAELAEWRKATMLDNQDTATPDHLRQLIQDMGDDAVRQRVDRNDVKARLDVALVELEEARASYVKAAGSLHDLRDRCRALPDQVRIAIEDVIAASSSRALDDQADADQVIAALVAAVVCGTCLDTHVMDLHDARVSCTRCPVPCESCRSSDRGAYCATAPCTCTCHRTTTSGDAT